jgi:hypothetical protein
MHGAAMHLTSEQLQIASRIDTQAQTLIAAGHDDLTIVTGMLEHLPDFKRLLDAGQDVMDELCRRFFWFFRYAKVLERMAAGIQSGAITVPRSGPRSAGLARLERALAGPAANRSSGRSSTLR